MRTKTLEEFLVSRDTGFMIQHQDYQLSEKYSSWITAVENLPEHVQNGTAVQLIEDLPTIIPDYNEKGLGDSKILQLKAYSLIQHLCAAYMVEKSKTQNDTPIKIPNSIAEPILRLIDMTQLPAAISHDTKEILSAENMDIVFKLDRSEDYRWFFVVAGQTELSAAEGINEIYEYTKSEDRNELTVLKTVANCLTKMNTSLAEMYKKCNQSVFYNTIRLYLTFPPNGILLGDKGGETPIKIGGASAAQSSVVPLMDTFLGIDHHESVKSFLDTMKKYMPRPHFEFIEYVKEHCKLRKHLKAKKDQNLIELYNECLDAMLIFRRDHYKLVCSYVVDQSGGRSASELKGTGTSTIEHFLNRLIDATENARLSLS
ncbi:hypothetical protein ACOME3_001775 [Neoechinorhynchus agilis]